MSRLPSKNFLEKEPTPAKRRSKKTARSRALEIEKGLEAIYKNSENGTDDLSVLDRDPGRGRWILVCAIFFFAILSAAAWAGFFIFRPAEKFAGKHIDFSLSSSTPTLISGQEEEIIIHYKNNENVPLGEVEISAAFPKEFIVSFRDPEAPEAGSWKIGSLPKGAEGEIKVRGKVLTRKGKDLTFGAYFSYRPVNFNSDFQKVATYTLPVSGSILGVSIEGPEKAIPGEMIAYKIIFQNNGEKEIDNAEARLTYAENFFPAKAEPAPREGGGRWILPKLKAGEKGEIKLTGNFSSAAEGNRDISVEIGTLGDGGLWQAQELVASTVELVKSELGLLLVANGSAKNGIVNFGDTVRYSLTFQNKSEVSLSDVVITAHLSATPVSGSKSLFLWDTLKDELGGRVRGTEITWSKKEYPKLGRLESGEEGGIDFSLDLIGAPFLQKESDYRVQIYVEAEIGRIGKVKTARIVRSEVLESRFLSDLIFGNEARYFNDDDIALGTGPVPPRLGETTTYRIWWTVKNSLHEVEAAHIRTVLPDGVVFTGKFNSGEIGALTYDEKERKVIWEIGKIPVASPELKAEFEVAITPAEDQLGKVIDLTNITNFEGRDLAAEALLFRAGASLNTDLENDPNLAGRGTVRK